MVNAPEYSHLNLLRSKDEIDIPGMSKGDAIVWAWKNAEIIFLCMEGNSIKFIYLICDIYIILTDYAVYP